jgi:hypothetical protein
MTRTENGRRTRAATAPSEAGVVDWTIPGETLPIDGAVNRYIRPALRRDFFGNPYKVARRFAVMALVRAELAEQSADAIRLRDEQLEHSVPKMEDLTNRVRAFLDDDWWFVALTAVVARGTSRPREAEDRARWEKIDAARRTIALSLPALRTISKEANKRLSSKEKRGEGRDDFMAGFIEPLAFCWKELSGRELRPASRQFALFVGSAIDTLLDQSLPKRFYLYADALKKLEKRRAGLDKSKRDGRRAVAAERTRPKDQEEIDAMHGGVVAKLNAKADEWRERNAQIGRAARKSNERDPWALWQCRSALKEMAKRQQWDQPDRTVNDLWPPDRKSKKPKQLATDNELRAAIRVMERGGDDADSAAIRLARDFNRASPDERSRYYSLGFHPDIAMAIRFGSEL